MTRKIFAVIGITLIVCGWISLISEEWAISLICFGASAIIKAFIDFGSDIKKLVDENGKED